MNIYLLKLVIIILSFLVYEMLFSNKISKITSSVLTHKMLPCKGGQASYDSSILSFYRCCYDNRAQQSCPLRDREKEERK